MVSFPGATSKKVLHYVDVHQFNSFADTVLLHFGVNDLLEDKSQSKIENLGKNLNSMVEKCHTYGIKNVFISGLVYTTRIVLQVLERTHEMIEHFCNKLGICYVENRNLRRKQARGDRHKYGGELIEFVRQGFESKHGLRKHELNCSECICYEFTISNKKRICFILYRPPSTGSIKAFFEEMNEVISKALCRYENLIVMADFKIDN